MIRLATVTDIQHIARMATETVQIMKEEKNDQWDETYPLPEHFQHDVENGTIFVKELDHEVVGSITIDRDFSEAYSHFSWEQPIEQTMIFHRLVVNPAIRKKGIASQLIEFAEQHARTKGCTSMKVDTYSLNQKAQGLFLRHSYRPVGELKLPERANPFYFYEKTLI
ncbi:GNAT family N-acetyltransferase [Alkalicoccobacillus plakortidis]|uniref:GNAT family N-acetyltransferase n=1 Tax=Alkalicoccobacillus plakortidis TaxID=444060 RepID=A0ABT0XMQ5_9BACI|nr:GNAT family N-acetyltransferase [Alkalicoccobacillus plakortidis]MCM2677192.1 GNAT family N-acetyltransferase [Alkalicoccobacillus plakortidis]